MVTTDAIRSLTGAAGDYDPLLARASAEEALRDFRRFPAWM